LIEEYKKEDYFQKENEKDFNCTKLYKKNKIDYVEIKLCNSLLQGLFLIAKENLKH
jgi:hypothetical protein